MTKKRATTRLPRALARPSVGALAAVLVVACAGAPTPGSSGRAYDVDGRYAGPLVVEGERFDAVLDLDTDGRGRLRGSFSVHAPLEIGGDVDGVAVNDLLRIRLTYESAQPDGSGTCESSVVGILTVEADGSVIEGPVTVTDCGDALAGRMSLRRTGGGGA